MNEHHHQHQHNEHQEICDHLAAIPGAIQQLERVLAGAAAAGSLRRLHLTQAEPRQLDDAGANALALGIYNPNNFRVYVGAGGDAAPDSFVVPKQKLVVAPIQVNGAIDFLADETDIGEVAGKAGFIWRVRFPTPQPFAAHSLA